MHHRQPHQLAAVLAQGLLHQGQARPVAEHVAGGPQQAQQPTADIRVGGHHQQLIAAHAVQDHLCGAQDAGADAHKAHATAFPQLLEHVQLVAEVVEIHRYSPHPVLLGNRLHRLQEVAAGNHRAVVGAFQYRIQLLHRHHLHRHLQLGGEFFCDQHRGADVLPRRAYQHPGAAAQAPIDLAGEQIPRLLQRAACIQQTIDALAHFSIDIRQAAAPRAGRQLDIAGLLLIAHVDARTGHGLHHAIDLQLAVHLADRVAVQSGLHRQLARTRQPVARRVVTGRNGKADLVVQLARGRDVAVLLNVEAHAGVGQSGCWPPYGALGPGTIPPLAQAAVPGCANSPWPALLG